MDGASKRLERRRSRVLAVADPGGQLLGSVSLHKFDPEQVDAEAGYWIAPWARGRRTGTLALATAERFAFPDLQLHRLHLYHAVENVRSCRVADAAGFTLEGRLRQSHRYADGDYHNEHLHARLATDPPR
jgi:RimJ/RimL family protein N-acetyltransferase